MPTYLATFVVENRHSDTEAINSAVGVLDFVPVVQAVNMHIFLIRSEKSRAQLTTLFNECIDPKDYCYVVEHPEPEDMQLTLKESLKWLTADST